MATMKYYHNEVYTYTKPELRELQTKNKFN